MRALPLLLLPFLATPLLANEAQIAKGRAFAEANCARCHAVGTTDHSPNPRSIPFRFVGRLYPIDYLAEALAEGIAVSHEMPEFVLEADQVEPLLLYLDSIQVR